MARSTSCASGWCSMVMLTTPRFPQQGDGGGRQGRTGSQDDLPEIVCACVLLTEQDSCDSERYGARTREGDLRESEPFCSESWCPFRARATGEASPQTRGRRLLLALLGAGSLPAATGNCDTRRDALGALAACDYLHAQGHTSV